MTSHVGSRRVGRQEKDEFDETRSLRYGRTTFSRLDSSSLATVRELLREIRRLEDEV